MRYELSDYERDPRFSSSRDWNPAVIEHPGWVSFKVFVHHPSSGVLDGRLPSQPRVWAVDVVVLPPGLEDAAGVRDGAEQGLIEKLIPQPPDEAFREGVLNRLARLDVMPRHTALVGPAEYRVRGELGAIAHQEDGSTVLGGALSHAERSTLLWAVMAGRQISRVMVFEASFRRWTDHDQATCYSR